MNKQLRTSGTIDMIIPETMIESRKIANVA